MSGEQYYERHSLASALGTSLNNTGWGIGQVREGFQSELEIQPPMVAVVFLPSRMIELQLGRKLTGNKSYRRAIQVTSYMETEPRAMAIGDDVADFLDLFYINITDPSSNNIGVLYCPDSESIVVDTLPPNISDARVQRWKSVVSAVLEADYFV